MRRRPTVAVATQTVVKNTDRNNSTTDTFSNNPTRYDSEIASNNQTEISINSLYLDDTPFFDRPNDPRTYAHVITNKQVNQWLIDTGAVVCVIAYTNESELERYSAIIRSTDIVINTVHSMRAPATGIVDLVYEFNNRTKIIPTVLIKARKAQFIAGMSFCHAFDVILKVEPGFYLRNRDKFHAKDVMTAHISVAGSTQIIHESTRAICPIHDSNPYKNLSQLLELDPNVQREKLRYLELYKCVCKKVNGKKNSNQKPPITSAEAGIDVPTSTSEIGSGSPSPVISKTIQLSRLGPLTNANQTRVVSKRPVCELGIDSHATDSSAAALFELDVAAFDIEIGSSEAAVETLGFSKPESIPNNKPIRYVDPTSTLQKLWSEHNSFRLL